MIRGRCEGCGKRTLLVSYRGEHCLTCVVMSSERRAGDRRVGWDAEAVALGATPTRRRIGVMSAANIAEGRRLRESGMTIRAIGQRFGVSESYIARFIPKTGRADRSTGVEPGEQARARAAEPPLWPEGSGDPLKDIERALIGGRKP